MKINRSADNPSGLVISEFQRAQIAGLEKALSNINRAISTTQTADGGLSEIDRLLVELRSVAIDAANRGALDEGSLAADQAHVEGLLAAIDRVANTTRFGTRSLLDGSSGITGLAVGPNVTLLTATDPSIPAATTHESLEVVVTQAPERAVLTNGANGVTGTTGITEAETLFINDVAISLSAGFNLERIINEINTFRDATGVSASREGEELVLKSVLFGSRAYVSVFSTRGVSGQSGFGPVYQEDSGVDVAGIIGGGSASGIGNILVGDTGEPGSGVVLQIAENVTVGVAPGPGPGGLPDSGPAIRAGIGNTVLPANDDGSTGLVAIGFEVNFFGQRFSSLYVNNNGNITFDSPLGTYTPFDLLSTSRSIIAPFFADVDTRASNTVTYGADTVGGRQVFAANYIDVGHYSMGQPTNSFQVVLVDRTDIAGGDFDIEFNYGRILWEAGTASGSNSQGLGGSSARVGWSNGIDRAFELPGSAVNGALLDSGPADTSLVQNNRGSAVPGRYVFQVRAGNVTPAPSGPAGIVHLVNNSLVFHTGAFANDNEEITLDRADSQVLGIGVAGQQFARLSEINVRFPDGANDAIRVIDSAIRDITQQRGTIGAFQSNTLEATQSNLWTQLVDLRSAESVLRDTDFAGTISNLVAEQVRQDVATAVLGLANQSVGAVIDLLQQSTPAPLNAAKPSKLKHS